MDKHPFVISIGNISMGGTGKTPFTIFLADFFSGNNDKVAILSLGYKGKSGYGTNIVSDGKALQMFPPYAADEPFMMAKALLNKGVAVITGKERTKSYELAVKKLGSTVFLLDDGFQHKRMRRDVNIVLMDYKNPISTGLPFPFGYLREFPSALSRADVIVFTRAASTEIPQKALKYVKDKNIFFCEHIYKCFIQAETHYEKDFIIGKKVWLMSGIANQNQFETQLKNCGAEILGKSKFKDHHLYKEDELRAVIRCAKTVGADIIVTTEKDMVKVPQNMQNEFMYPVVSINMLNNGLTEYLVSRKTI